MGAADGQAGIDRQDPGRLGRLRLTPAGFIQVGRRRQPSRASSLEAEKAAQDARRSNTFGSSSVTSDLASMATAVSRTSPGATLAAGTLGLRRIRDDNRPRVAVCLFPLPPEVCLVASHAAG